MSHRTFVPSRRLFLQGAGAVVALPFLESFAPRPVSAQEVGAPPFAIIIRNGCGVQQANEHGIVPGTEPERFWPQQLGALSTASMMADSDRATSELARHADHLLIARGITLPYPGYTCAHANSCNQLLTASPWQGEGHTTRPSFESIDNRAARQLTPGQEPLTLFAGPRYGYIDDMLSYRENGELRAGEQNPFLAYSRLFGMPSGEDATSLLFAQRKSVNDVVRADLQALLGRTDLSSIDRHRLEQHFDSIRDLEAGLTCSLSGAEYAELASVMESTIANEDYIDQMVRLHMKVMLLAGACGTSPISTLQIGNGTDGVQYTVNGEKQPRFHHISHRLNGDGAEGSLIVDAVDRHHQLDRLFLRWYAALIDEMDSAGVLGQGTAIWCNDLGTGDHDYNNVPFLFAGSCGGYFKQGQYVDAGTTNNQILNAIGAAVGVTSADGAPLHDFGGTDLPRGASAALLA